MTKTFESYCSKRVSYILTTKNHAKYLDKALTAYRKLIKPQDELIVIDGASLDGTSKILKKYQDLIDILISEPDRSATDAFNKGILLARGKYIKNLNDDDTIYPTAMEKAIGVMEKHKEVDLLVCGGTKENNGKKGFVYLLPGTGYGRSCQDVFLYGACGVGFIIRKSSMAYLGLCPDRVASDSALALEFIKNGGVVKFCRINLYNHPIYAHSMINAKSDEVYQEAVEFTQKYLSKSFYWRYRIMIFFSLHPINLQKLYQRFPFTRLLFLPASFLYKKFMDLINPQKTKMTNNQKLIWDGGFS